MRITQGKDLMVSIYSHESPGAANGFDTEILFIESTSVHITRRDSECSAQSDVLREQLLLLLLQRRCIVCLFSVSLF